MKLGFIGIGNMGGAILEGYSRTAEKKGNELLAYDRDSEKLASLAKRCPVTICDDIDMLVRYSDAILMAIKPNQFPEVLPQVAKSFQPGKVLVSIAAGITLQSIAETLGEEAPIVRVMPNTPAQVGLGMTAVCRNGNVDDECYAQIMEVFTGIGVAEDVPEEQIHCVIGISGSSPAYTYMYIEALMNAAIAEGMTEDKARIFAAQAVMGAAAMVLHSDKSPEQLRIDVCSPGGTTIEAVNELMERGFMETVESGFAAAVEKSRRMSQ